MSIIRPGGTTILFLPNTLKDLLIYIRSLAEDGHDVVLLDLLGDAGPELALHVPRSLSSLGRQVLHQSIKF